MKNFTDMSKTDKEIKEDSFPNPVSSQSKYPWGLCISLDKFSLDKLGVSHSEFCVGDLIHLRAMAQVTSVSETMQADGEPSCRVELQITHLGLEDEGYEDEDDKEPTVRPYF